MIICVLKMTDVIIQIGGSFMYTVELPRVLCIALVLSKYLKGVKYFNTNDLANIANTKKQEIVRSRKDKEDYEYRFFHDTKFGGLRGNLSTGSTLQGLIKRNNRVTAFYSIGPGEKLINAVIKGDILIDTNACQAKTNKLELKEILEKEAKYRSIREDQAHITNYINRTPSFALKRDCEEFPKQGVLKSNSNQYFFRILFNTYKEPNKIEYNLFDYLQGPKIKRKNIHALFVVPSNDNNWDKFYVIDAKQLLITAPLFLYYDIEHDEFRDEHGILYFHEELIDALSHISNENGNSEERLSYNYKKAMDALISNSIETTPKRTETEESVFIKNFLNCSLLTKIFIKGQEIIGYSIHKAGVDVLLAYANGTTQSLELEQEWSHYIAHGHQNNIAWKDAWIYANEKFDFDKIQKIFGPYKGLYIPNVFLSSDPVTKERKAFEVDWTSNTFKELKIDFH